MELFEFYKEAYYKELDKKDEINSGLSVPMSIASAMFAGLFFMFTNFHYDFENWLSILFIVLISISCTLLLAAVFYLSRAYNDSHIIDGYSYQRLTNVQNLDDHYKLLKEYYAGSSDSETQAKKDFEQDVMQQMISNTAINQKNNIEKLEYFRLCRKFLLFCLVASAITLVPFGFNYATADHTPAVNVKLVDPLPSK